MKKILGLGAAGLVVPAAIASALLAPVSASADPGSLNAMNVVGEPYAKAVVILKSQGVKATFGGSFGSDLPQSQCIVSQQKVNSKNKMILMLDCTQAAADHASDSTPAAPSAPAAGGTAPAPGAGQGTYGGPIGVPVPVG
ncbi:hypothetical protein [Mycolicibacterium sp. 050158]|uniref:hypothetical protein n=1 Tax=Mycolicibacterium sp. 050158 TaxID=3090602 RepID=UPI00299E73DC|nr:hypothetical protein [Mycolicibacterium sp. 050158]MDX1891955.1 hypothetical protein [Mycolicibacterium sp. 050158]